jgi:hypothetical protein
MAERTGISRLTCALAEELAGNMRSICMESASAIHSNKHRLGPTLFSGRAARPIESPHRSSSMWLATGDPVRASWRNIERSRTHVSEFWLRGHRRGWATVVQHHGLPYLELAMAGLRRGLERERGNRLSGETSCREQKSRDVPQQSQTYLHERTDYRRRVAEQNGLVVKSSCLEIYAPFHRSTEKAQTAGY